ncbi:uncharacterized protein BcabD6B2_35430 [Babesia caballi]|uniref:Uncharacterized protein n=1 Tax=Babesia caballi TaxID=5871 RepID=A0AAV4LVA9_BABCB|nr:hypothetical protein BcabD6B2_35430 [Babesia caballi]
MREPFGGALKLLEPSERQGGAVLVAEAGEFQALGDVGDRVVVERGRQNAHHAVVPQLNGHATLGGGEGAVLVQQHHSFGGRGELGRLQQVQGAVDRRWLAVAHVLALHGALEVGGRQLAPVVVGVAVGGELGPRLDVREHAVQASGRLLLEREVERAVLFLGVHQVGAVAESHLGRGHLGDLAHAFRRRTGRYRRNGAVFDVPPGRESAGTLGADTGRRGRVLDHVVHRLGAGEVDGLDGLRCFIFRLARLCSRDVCARELILVHGVAGAAGTAYVEETHRVIPPLIEDNTAATAKASFSNR